MPVVRPEREWRLTEPIELGQVRPEQEKKTEIRGKRQGQMDVSYFILVVMLSVIGLIMLLSASFASMLQDVGDASYLFVRQGIFMLLGLAAMLIISRINYQVFRTLAIPMLLVSLVLLALVSYFGVELNHARRWFDLGFITVQPSEIAKLAIIVCFAAMISTFRERMKTFRYGVLPFAAILAVVAYFLYEEPHLSAIVLIMGVGVTLLFAGGTRLVWFVLLAAVGVAVAYLLVTRTAYAQDRIDLWRDPWIEGSKGRGQQTIQSLYAIGSGGMFGLGLGRSQQKFLYLPEEHNDFIFAIVCEELGLFGAVIILLLFVALIMRGYWIAIHARDRFGSLMVTGVTTLLAIQTFLSVAVVTNLIPVTGISMPFFSAGGSALLIQLTEMGIVLAVSRQIPPPRPKPLRLGRRVPEGATEGIPGGFSENPSAGVSEPVDKGAM